MGRLNKRKKFTRKVKKVIHLPIFFNNKPVPEFSLEKHLDLILDTSLKFDEHMKVITSKVSKIIVFTTIYKSFMRPHLECCNVILDKAYNNSFQQRLELLNTRHR